MLGAANRLWRIETYDGAPSTPQALRSWGGVSTAGIDDMAVAIDDIQAQNRSPRRCQR
jgi:hypothetical protein